MFGCMAPMARYILHDGPEAAPQPGPLHPGSLHARIKTTHAETPARNAPVRALVERDVARDAARLPHVAPVDQPAQCPLLQRVRRRQRGVPLLGQNDVHVHLPRQHLVLVRVGPAPRRDNCPRPLPQRLATSSSPARSLRARLRAAEGAFWCRDSQVEQVGLLQRRGKRVPLERPHDSPLALLRHAHERNPATQGAPLTWRRRAGIRPAREPPLLPHAHSHSLIDRRGAAVVARRAVASERAQCLGEPPAHGRHAVALSPMPDAQRWPMLEPDGVAGGGQRDR